MKSAYRNFGFIGLTGLLCLFLALPASAQHHGGGGGHSGGGGGGHYSGGGGRSSGGGARFSGGGARVGASRAYSPSAGRAAPRYNGGTYNRGSVNAYRGGTYNRGSVNAYRGGAYNRGGVNAYRGGAYNRGAYGRGSYGRNLGYYGGRGYYARGYGWYGRGYGWHPGGWYFHGGFYGSLYWPRLGFSLGYLPYGYYPFYFGDAEFYYSNGYYYQYDNNQYTVVEPPIGAVVNSLPSNAQSIVIDGQQYYELNGVYYVAITKDDGSLGYQIAGKDGELNTGNNQNDPNQDQQGPPPAQGQGYQAPPADNNQQPTAAPTTDANGPQIGDLVAELPQGCRKVTVNGTKVYVSPDDITYQETRDNNNQKAYKIVGLPEDNN